MDTSNWHNRSTHGLALVLIGGLLLLANTLNLGEWGLALLGGGFIAAGAVTRLPWPMIPGGILAGLAAGTQLSAAFGRTDQIGGAWFLLGFAAGWALIALTTRLLTDRPQRWPLIPAGVSAIIGALLLAADPSYGLLRLGTLLWPVALIIAGVGLIAARRHEVRQ